MIPRPVAIQTVYRELNTAHFVSALGRISRDLFKCSGEDDKCFYCLGSMGNVIPFSMGLAKAHPLKRFVALEGDGSLLMNLGCLATLRRYPCPQLKVVILDNQMYESTGEQPARDPTLDLVTVASAILPKVAYAEDLGALVTILSERVFTPELIVIACSPHPAAPRIPLTPKEIKERFIRGLAVSQFCESTPPGKICS